jgi:hypothetical protein
MGMTSRHARFVGLPLAARAGAPVAALVLGCGSSGAGYSLSVGSDDGGTSLGSGSGDASDHAALHAHIEQDHMSIQFLTLSCTGPCADVVAVATGGYGPYTFAWDDGSTSASRHVCPTASTNYSVKVTDSGSSGEFARAAETVQVPLPAHVIACPDGGTLSGDAGVAPTVYWATWAQMQPGTPGTAEGSFAPPTGSIEVTYVGEVGSTSAPTGTPLVTALGEVSFLPASSFLSPTVGNVPPATGMIVLDGSAMLTQTITFAAPVKDPLLAVTSLGDSAVASKMVLAFDATPEILSSGSETVGSLTLPGMLSVSGQSLTGVEGTGVVQFAGTFTSIRFTVPVAEVGGSGYLTVGIRGPG